jgi:putative cardiolipin synthase
MRNMPCLHLRIDSGNILLKYRESDWIKLLNTSDEAQRWRLAMIDSAHSSIDLETFLWKPDQMGARILAHLLAAADRGVKVRILLDDSFTEHEDLALYYLDLHPNIELRLYNPYHARVDSMAGGHCSTSEILPASIIGCTIRP